MHGLWVGSRAKEGNACWDQILECMLKQVQKFSMNYHRSMHAD